MSRAPTGSRDALVLRDRVGDAAGERHAAALDADERQTLGAGLLLDDLVGDADRRAADLLGGHDLAAAHRGPPGRPSLTLVALLSRPRGPVVKGSVPKNTAAVPASRR